MHLDLPAAESAVLELVDGPTIQPAEQLSSPLRDGSAYLQFDRIKKRSASASMPAPFSDNASTSFSTSRMPSYPSALSTKFLNLSKLLFRPVDDVN